jgi:hypothetical protein
VNSLNGDHSPQLFDDSTMTDENGFIKQNQRRRNMKTKTDLGSKMDAHLSRHLLCLEFFLSDIWNTLVFQLVRERYSIDVKSTYDVRSIKMQKRQENKSCLGIF